MKCDYCTNRAVVNLQKVWVRFLITKNEDYERDTQFNGCDIEPTYDDNFHLCKKHEKEWLAGRI